MCLNMNKKLIRLTESDLHKIVKEAVYKIIDENNMNEGITDYIGAFRRGWNTPIHTYGNELQNTRGALRAMTPSGSRELRGDMNAERTLGLQGYNTRFEKDVKQWLRGKTKDLSYWYTYNWSPEAREYWNKVKAKAEEISNNHSKEDIHKAIGYFDGPLA